EYLIRLIPCVRWHLAKIYHGCVQIRRVQRAVFGGSQGRVERNARGCDKTRLTLPLPKAWVVEPLCLDSCRIQCIHLLRSSTLSTRSAGPSLLRPHLAKLE